MHTASAMKTQCAAARLSSSGCTICWRVRVVVVDVVLLGVVVVAVVVVTLVVVVVVVVDVFVVDVTVVEVMSEHHASMCTFGAAGFSEWMATHCLVVDCV